MGKINSIEAKLILKHAIPESSVIITGAYTKPRTWGVYEIEPQASMSTTRKFRIGNHPIRQRELDKEFDDVQCHAIFPARVYAEELEQLLNGRKTSK